MNKLASQTVIFRADASILIGTGHIIRCVTLANKLRSKGINTLFLCRSFEGNLIEFIREQGHSVEVLEKSISKVSIDPSVPHSQWLGCSWETDANDCLKAIKRKIGEQLAAWIVVDHYALDVKWESMMQCVAERTMIIDDLADRQHFAHLLLDQNAGRKPSDYASLLNCECETLIGPKFALLRPEFNTLRDKSNAIGKAKLIKKRLLVSLGGVDKDNITFDVLKALSVSACDLIASVTVILGANSPWKMQVTEYSKSLPLEVHVKINVSNMAMVMNDSDVCIGAAGSTAWERCALGLPTLQIVLADNQEAAAKALAQKGASIALPHPKRPEFANMLRLALEKLTEPRAYEKMSNTAFGLTDGKGTEYISKKLVSRINLDAR